MAQSRASEAFWASRYGHFFVSAMCSAFGSSPRLRRLIPPSAPMNQARMARPDAFMRLDCACINKCIREGGKDLVQKSTIKSIIDFCTSSFPPEHIYFYPWSPEDVWVPQEKYMYPCAKKGVQKSIINLIVDFCTTRSARGTEINN